MFQATLDVIDSISIFTLKGSLDSYGASVFEREISLLSRDVSDLIIDFSEIDYLSSLGIRSLLKLEKSLIARSGGMILVGLTPFISQVLDLAGLLKHFRSLDSLDQALSMLRDKRIAGHAIKGVTIRGRKYMIRTLSDEGSGLDLWGAFPARWHEAVSAKDLTPVSLQDLGPCLGIGGLGQDSFQASGVLGEFVAAGHLAGVVPADGHCIPDFMLTDRPSESTVYIASAVGISGTASLFLEHGNDAPITIEALIADIFSIVAELRGDTSPMMGIILFAETIETVGSHFRDLSDIALYNYQTEHFSDEGVVVIVGITVDETALQSSDDEMPSLLLEEMRRYGPGNGRFFHGHGLTLTGSQIGDISGNLNEGMQQIVDLNRLKAVIHVEPGTKIRHPKVWVYLPSRIRPGIEKLLRIEVEDGARFQDEWEIIARRILSDAAKAVLTPIHGGFMSKTFHVASYGRDGRRLLPTVLKIGSLDTIRREEKAYHEYVEKFILNNSTTIMGTASYGNWAALRYNFVGISGPDSRLSWLSHHYVERPAGDLIPIFETIFTNILRPWYGQPKWEEIYPFAEHNPMNLFPGILEDAEKLLGISADEVTLPCPALNMDLPNPFHFLKHQYPLRMKYSKLWYKSITHGDLNMRNILLDEWENIYIIDFSETRPRNVVSDFARLEAILKIEMTRLESEQDLEALLQFEAGLAETPSLEALPKFTYTGSDSKVEKAYKIISLLRRFANTVTIFETDIIPYILALLEWTYPVVSYQTASLLQKRFAAYSCGIYVKKILED